MNSQLIVDGWGDGSQLVSKVVRCKDISAYSNRESPVITMEDSPMVTEEAYDTWRGIDNLVMKVDGTYVGRLSQGSLTVRRGLVLSWDIYLVGADPKQRRVSLTLQHNLTSTASTAGGWMAFGISAGGEMLGSEVLIGFETEGVPYFRSAELSSKAEWATLKGRGNEDEGRVDLRLTSYSVEEGIATLSSVLMPHWTEQLTNRDFHVIWAFSDEPWGGSGQAGHRASGATLIDFEEGVPSKTWARHAWLTPPLHRVAVLCCAIAAALTVLSALIIAKHVQLRNGLGRWVESTKHQRLDHRPKKLRDESYVGFSFTNVNYWAPSGSQIIRGVTGFINPGDMVALMGPSGAGKTTMMNLLAGRADVKAGICMGTLNVNGVPCDLGAKHGNTTLTRFHKHIGYMLQLTNSQSASLTVRENLVYAALIRMPKDVPLHAKMAHVDQLLAELDLLDHANTKVGGSMGGGISGGQKRMLQLGIEMLGDPPVLFLDEPTSGLDTSNALSVTTTLNRLATSGRSILISIHQPRIEIFSQFDKVMVMHKGRLAFYGTPPSAAAFFVSCASFLGNSIGKKSSNEGLNPADVMLDLLNEEGSISVEMQELLHIDVNQNFNDAEQSIGVYASSIFVTHSVPKIHAAIEAATDTIPANLGSSASSHKDSPLKQQQAEQLVSLGSRCLSALRTLWLRVWVAESRLLLSSPVFELAGALITGLLSIGIVSSAIFQPTLMFTLAGSLQQSLSATPLILQPLCIGVFYNSLIKCYRWESLAGFFTPLQFFVQHQVHFFAFSMISIMPYAVIAYLCAVDAHDVTTLAFVCITFALHVLVYQAIIQCTAAFVWWGGEKSQNGVMVTFMIFGTLIFPLFLFQGFFIPYKDAPVAWQWFFWLSPGYYSYACLLRITLEGYTKSAGCVRKSSYGARVACEYQTSGDALLELYGVDDIDIAAYYWSLLLFWAVLLLCTLAVLHADFHHLSMRSLITKKPSSRRASNSRSSSVELLRRQISILFKSDIVNEDGANVDRTRTVSVPIDDETRGKIAELHKMLAIMQDTAFVYTPGKPVPAATRRESHLDPALLEASHESEKALDAALDSKTEDRLKSVVLSSRASIGG